MPLICETCKHYKKHKRVRKLISGRVSEEEAYMDCTLVGEGGIPMPHMYIVGDNCDDYVVKPAEG